MLYQEVRDPTRFQNGKAAVIWLACFSRGLATSLNRLGVSDKVIQQILLHADVTTTTNIYVKMVSQEVTAAMKTLEANMQQTLHQERLIGISRTQGNLLKREQQVSLAELHMGGLREGGFEPSVQF